MTGRRIIRRSESALAGNTGSASHGVGAYLEQRFRVGWPVKIALRVTSLIRTGWWVASAMAQALGVAASTAAKKMRNSLVKPHWAAMRNSSAVRS